MPTDSTKPSNLPNLRRLFVEARTDAEESEYSRNAVCSLRLPRSSQNADEEKFYNLVIFMSSIAGFSLIAQRMMTGKNTTI
jgi:hypothetical protein